MGTQGPKPRTGSEWWVGPEWQPTRQPEQGQASSGGSPHQKFGTTCFPSPNACKQQMVSGTEIGLRALLSSALHHVGQTLKVSERIALGTAGAESPAPGEAHRHLNPTGQQGRETRLASGTSMIVTRRGGRMGPGYPSQVRPRRLHQLTSQHCGLWSSCCGPKKVAVTPVLGPS